MCQSWESAQAAWSKCTANEGCGMCKKSKDVATFTQWAVTPFLIAWQKTPYPLTQDCTVFCHQCRQRKCKKFAGIFNSFTRRIYSFPLFCNSYSWIKISTDTGCTENGWRAALKEKDWRMFVDKKLDITQQCVFTAQKARTTSKEGILLCCSCETPTWWTASSSGAPNIKQHIDQWEWVQRRTVKIFRGLEHISYGNRLREFGLRRA